MKAAVEAQTGGSLETYVPNEKEDAAHWWAARAVGPGWGCGLDPYL